MLVYAVCKIQRAINEYHTSIAVLVNKKKSKWLEI